MMDLIITIFVTTSHDIFSHFFVTFFHTPSYVSHMVIKSGFSILVLQIFRQPLKLLNFMNYDKKIDEFHKIFLDPNKKNSMIYDYTIHVLV